VKHPLLLAPPATNWNKLNLSDPVAKQLFISRRHSVLETIVQAVQSVPLFQFFAPLVAYYFMKMCHSHSLEVTTHLLP
jgi:hypothetical protein